MSVTISGSLIHQVRLLYQNSLNDWFKKRNTLRQGINIYTESALPSFILCVSAVESLLNEAFISILSHHTISPSSSFKLMEKDSLEKIEIDQKLLLFPFLAFGKTFNKSAQPFQDFKMLVKLRNEIVHYKMKLKTPSFFQPLADRNIAFNHKLSVDEQKNSKIITIWINDINTTEAIRWGHNTVCNIVNEILNFIPVEQKSMFSDLASNFKIIKEETVIDIFINNGIAIVKPK